MTEIIKAPEGTYAFLAGVHQQHVDQFGSHNLSLFLPNVELQIYRERVVELESQKPLRYTSHEGKVMCLKFYKDLGNFAGVTYNTLINPDDTLKLITASPNSGAIALGIEVPPPDINYMLRAVRVALGPEINCN